MHLDLDLEIWRQIGLFQLGCRRKEVEKKYARLREQRSADTGPENNDPPQNNKRDLDKRDNGFCGTDKPTISARKPNLFLQEHNANGKACFAENGEMRMSSYYSKEPLKRSGESRGTTADGGSSEDEGKNATGPETKRTYNNIIFFLRKSFKKQGDQEKIHGSAKFNFVSNKIHRRLVLVSGTVLVALPLKKKKRKQKKKCL
jgi:hypothetical protein